MRRIIISVLILTMLGATASAAPNITLTLNTTMDGGNATVTSITKADLLDRAGGIIEPAVLQDDMTAQFDLNGITPGDYFIEINGLAGDRVPTRIDSNATGINQSVGRRLINSVIGNETIPTIYRIKARSGGRHPVVNYNTGANETKYPFVIVSALTSKIEVRAVNTSEELSNFSTSNPNHDGLGVPFQTWMLGSSNHGIAYNGTDTCSGCHGNLAFKQPNYANIIPLNTSSGGWCFKCHNGPGGDASGFVDPVVVAANGTIAGTVTNESGLAISNATVTADSQSNITDLNGNYTISIGSGTYTLTASATGYQSNSTSITVTSGATVTQNFALTQQLQPEQKFNISGFKIDNSTGMGLANWTITLTKPDGTVMNNLTDSNGMYRFMNLSNGTYTITEEMQPGWTNVSAMTLIFTLSGWDMMNQNFTNKLLPPAGAFNISGFKIDNSTGMGLANWNITLTKPDNTVMTNVTDSNGMYQFMNLSNGTYTLAEQMRQGWTNVSAMNMTVTIAGSDLMDQNFTNRQLQTGEAFNISGFKLDNSTGMGLANWNITLTKPDGTVMNNLTDSNGMYQFMNLPNGTYTVTEQMQQGWTNVSAMTMTVTINGSDMVNQNFTNMQLPPGGAFNISGFKIDNNTSMGLANWNITLTKPDNTTLTNVTDSSGMYQFMNLSNGTYTITEQMQPGWTNVSAMNMTVTINGSDLMDQNFTNRQLQVGEMFNISGFKIDNNGTGLANWNITLTKSDNTVMTNVTDSSGMYQFMNLSNGTYTITEEMQPGWTNVSAMTMTVTIAGSDMMNQNFTNRQLPSGGTFNISGFKIDNNGTGLANWTIALTKPDGTVMTNVTDSSGMYQFMNLTNGIYNVTEQMQQGWTNVSAMSMEVTIAGSDMVNQNFTNAKIPQQPNVTSFELIPDKTAALGGRTITITVKALNVNVTDTNFNGMANITVNASKNASAVTYQPNITFSNGIAILPVTSNISQFVTVTATSGNITGSTDIVFADMVFKLDMGWNLISIPNFADPSNVSLILKNVKNNGVVGYDPGNKTFSTPTDLQPLYGYWINVTAPNQSIGFIADTNIRSIPPSRDLFEGWNLIGVVASKQEQNKELDAGILFQPLKSGGKPLYSYLVSYKNPRMTYTVDDGLTDRTPLNKGQGYWLFMNTLTETNKDSLVWAGKPWLPN